MMIRSNLFPRKPILLLVFALFWSFDSIQLSHAAPLLPIRPVPRGADVPTGGRCTVEALNIGGIVSPDGSMLVPNVPAGTSKVRLRAICTDPVGEKSSGQSALANAVPGRTIGVDPVDFENDIPIASKLDIEPSRATLTGLNATQQLFVGATFTGAASRDVTEGAKGTTYRSSNQAVARVDENGRVTAIGAGTAILTAKNEGATGFAVVTVLTASLRHLDVTPDRVTISVNGAFSTAPVLLRTVGVLSDDRSVDLTSSSSGTFYSSSNPSVAQINADGAILGRARGETQIAVRNGGVVKIVDVTVNAFSPSPVAAYNTPGFAYGVDINGSLIFVADGSGGLRIHTEVNGAVVGTLSFGGSNAFKVHVRDTIAAVALLGSGIAIVDVANPARPREVSRISSIGTVKDVWISGNRVYAASTNGFYAYNISNLATPVAIGAVNGIDALSVSADSARNLAIVGTSSSGLRVIQMFPTRSWLQAAVAIPYPINDAILFGTSAYVVAGTGGIKQVDITNPTSPSLVQNSTITFDAVGIAVQRTGQGMLVAAADDYFINAVPLFNGDLSYLLPIDFSRFPGSTAIRVNYLGDSDANSTGIALGDGYGVVSVGYDGIQIFRTREHVDNAGNPPIVSISVPVGQDGLQPGVLAHVSATAIDDVGVSSVEFFVDGTSIGLDTSPPFTAEWLPDTPCSTQTLIARATDNRGIRNDLSTSSDSMPVRIRVLCEEAQPCARDGDCANNVCISSVCQAPCNLIYASCDHLKAECPTSRSGTHVIDPDGNGVQPAFQTYCDMTRADGGWTLVAKMTNQDAKHWVNDKSSWTGTAPYGDISNISAGDRQDAKSRAWSSLAAKDLMLTDNPDPASNQYIVTTDNCLEGRTPSQFFTTALAGYPTSSGQRWYKQCATSKTYVPDWTYTPRVIGADRESPNISLNVGYLMIGRSDETDSYAVFSFYAAEPLRIGPGYHPIFDSTGEFEADVGLAASQRNLSPFNVTGEAQDIGGPLSCEVNDVRCQTDYPQTVYFFVR